jgi:hypothetical protein
MSEGFLSLSFCSLCLMYNSSFQGLVMLYIEAMSTFQQRHIHYILFVIHFFENLVCQINELVI